MRKNYSMFMLLICLTSCRAKFKENNNFVRKEIDSDGDLVTDREEIKRGSNPFIADIPVLEHQISINGFTGVRLPILESYKLAAKDGKYEFHMEGKISKDDFFKAKWVKINENHQKVFLFTSEKMEEVQEIANIELNFYHHDIKRAKKFGPTLIKKNGRYNLNSSEKKIKLKIDKTLFFDSSPTAVKEKKLVEDIFFEIENYQISKLNTTYKKLMKSVMEKSIPVFINTPFGKEIFYVGKNGKKIRANEILKILFNEDFRVRNGKIIRIKNITNMIPMYRKNIELKLFKEGSWFVFTNKINKHFTDHFFNNKDFISFSYILGTELANHIEDKKIKKIDFIESNGNSLDVGTVNTNSSIELVINALNTEGKKYQVLNKAGRYSDFKGRCHYPKTIKENSRLFFNDANYSRYLQAIILLVNGKEFNLLELIKKGIAKLIAINKSDLKIKIDIFKIKNKILSKEKNKIAFKLNHSINNAPRGIEIVKFKVPSIIHQRYLNKMLGFMHKKCQGWSTPRNLGTAFLSTNTSFLMNNLFRQKVGSYLNSADMDYIEDFSIKIKIETTNYIN